MSIVQLGDTIKKRKQEPGLNIDKMSSESGINAILMGKDVCYSSIVVISEALKLHVETAA